MELLIVTGQSGAGKTRVINALEDIGFYCVDNIPPALLGGFADLCYSPAAHHGRTAIVMDSRSGKMFRELPDALKELRARHIPYRILFLEASDSVLLRRYKETRRRHPLLDECDGCLEDAIREERRLLEPIRQSADYTIDTTALSPSQLRGRIVTIFEGDTAPMLICCQSFGFRNGLPQDADLVSGCTIAVDRYRDAVVRACEQAKALGAAQGDRVTLNLIAADLPQDLAATDDQDAHVRADITLAALTVDGEGRVTSAIGDMTQPQLTVSADGTVSGPEEPVYTKNEQGDKYGMREASALHKEWYEHAEGYCSTLKGKTMAEIAAQPTDGSDADLKALCTISVTDLQKAVLAALAET